MRWAAAVPCLLMLLVCISVSSPATSTTAPNSCPATATPGSSNILWRLFRRLVQQAPQTCIPPHTSTRPFCWQPDTISKEAQAFLTTASSFKIPSWIPWGVFKRQGQKFFKMKNEKLHAAAVEKHLQAPFNSTIGGVPVVIAAPKGFVSSTSNADTKVLLYLHGGAYIIGSCQWLLNTVAATAAAANLTIICPEYRLAPENPFPAGLNDILTVYKAMIHQEGHDASNTVLLGDSSGGALAAAVAVQLQREGVSLPAALGMFSPWADLAARGDTTVTLAGVDPIMAGRDPRVNATVTGPALMYVNGNATLAETDPLVSPVLADYASLFGPDDALPPTLIQVGLRETFLSDAVRLYHKMKAAAPKPGHVVLSPYEGMWHVFQSYSDVPEAAAASQEMADFFLHALGVTPHNRVY